MNSGRAAGLIIGRTVQVLPGPGIPDDAPLGRANNNLDVLQSGETRWLAIRTSLVHFATRRTKIVVFRSHDDGETWHIDTDRRAVDWVADLPSRGDTAFPGIIWTGPDTLVVYNYSSPIGGPDRAWVAGQLGRTNIYSTPITFPS